MKIKYIMGLVVFVLVFVVSVSKSFAEETESQSDRTFVKGGIYDKPYITRFQGRTLFGGYTETAFRFEREEGLKEELTFSVERFNIFEFHINSNKHFIIYLNKACVSYRKRVIQRKC